MGKSNPFKLWQKAQAMIFHLTCVIIDGAFFCFWLLLQAALGALTTVVRPRLSMVNRYAWVVLEIVFAIATIIPVLIYTWYDIKAIWRTVSARDEGKTP